MRRLTCLILLLTARCFAAQSAPMPSHAADTDDPSGSNIFEQLNAELRLTNSRKFGVGEGTVDPRQARICEICKQPLWKHSLTDFQCIPLDPDGNPKKIQHIQTVGAQCPVCNRAFIGALPGNINDQAGLDRDFCAHNLGKFTVFSQAWACPYCGYAALIEHFNMGLDGKPIDEATKAFVQSTLSEPMKKRMFLIAGITDQPGKKVGEELLEFGSYIPQNEIPDWIKYENALKIYERQKPPRGFLATLYRDAAHACRREVCCEISVPGLHNSLQETLGKSIRRMNYYLQGQCMVIRRRQHAAILDMKMETDPVILAEAAAQIIRLGEENYATAVNANAPDQAAPERFFTTGDMYVLNIRYAGILDRAGKIDEAEKALRHADSFIPDRPAEVPDGNVTEAAREYFTRQLKLLHNVVQDRLVCLKHEKEYLFTAAKFNMTAIRLKEVQFGGEAPDADPKAQAIVIDAAPTSYLLGELLRRSGEPAAAAAWFDASNAIVTHRLETLDRKAEKDLQPNGEPTPEAKTVTAKVERWSHLLQWIKEQRALIKAPGAADPAVQETVAIVVQAEGLNLKAIQAAHPSAPAVKRGPDAAIKSVPTPSGPRGKIKTREDLYNAYYAAIMAYREKSKENPPALIDLVKGGFISSDDANLDDKGKLIDPESGDKIGYQRGWDKGDRSATVLWSLKDVRSKRLFADGSVREGEGK